MNLRRATASDAAALAAVEVLQPQAAGWGADGLSAELAQTCAVIFCAVEETGEMLGFAAARAAADSAEILNVAVHPQRTGQGIATALMQALLSQLQSQQVTQVTLEVAQDNISAMGLYRKVGFTACAVRKDFYGAGRDGLILRKEL